MDQIKVSESAADTLYIVRDDGVWLAVQGVIKSMDGQNCTITWRDEEKKIS